MAPSQGRCASEMCLEGTNLEKMDEDARNLSSQIPSGVIKHGLLEAMDHFER